jgi:hypothetical protein
LNPWDIPSDLPVWKQTPSFGEHRSESAKVRARVASAVWNGYGSIPIDTFLVGWTSIYQLFWGSLGTRVLTHPQILMKWCPAGFGLRSKQPSTSKRAISMVAARSARVTWLCNDQCMYTWCCHGVPGRWFLLAVKQSMTSDGSHAVLRLELIGTATN